MTSFQGSVLNPCAGLIHLNGHRKSQSVRKNEPLKIKMDAILKKDYTDWRSNRMEFNVLASQTAGNSQTVQSYVRQIYQEYSIADPLQQGKSLQDMRNITFQKQHSSVPQTDDNHSIRQQRYNRNALTTQKINRNAYETPRKHNKKGLQLINYSKQQKSPNENPFIAADNQFSAQKARFIQKTAPSLHSCDYLNYSRNRPFSSSTANKNRIQADLRDQMLINSRISLNRRLQQQQDKGNHDTFYSNPMLRTQNQPPKGHPNTSRQFLTRRQNQITSNRSPNIEKPITTQNDFKSSESLGYINPQRQINILKNQLFASPFIMVQSRRAPATTNGPIRQTFRYCVGCQSAVLQANIQYHQLQCKEFSRIFNLINIGEIIKQIDKKIDLIITKINQRKQLVTDRDKSQILQSSRRLTAQVSSSQGSTSLDQYQSPVKSRNFDTYYDKVMNVGKNWGLLTEQVNKLKWFLLVKDKLQIIKFQDQ